MSRFFSKTHAALTPYTPGEQPQNMKFVKLNTNESPFPPSKAAMEYAEEHLRSLNLYPDPECRELIRELAGTYGIREDQLVLSNGSDEVLFFIFKAFCDAETPVMFPDISYGFYPVFSEVNNLPYEEVPLTGELRVDLADYAKQGRTIVLANPNAPTGIALSRAEIEELLKAHPDNVVVIDEAYVDFGGESCIPLIDRYDNLIVVQTFSKSRSMAGARLGFAAANADLIRDINTIRNSFNPYNINSMTMASALGTLKDAEYTKANCRTIMENRAYTTAELVKLGFEVLDSKTNFVFARTDRMDGESLYMKLKAKGVLVRHFGKERIKDYNRITIGTREQMDVLLNAVREIFSEEQV